MTELLVKFGSDDNKVEIFKSTKNNIATITSRELKYESGIMKPKEYSNSEFSTCWEEVEMRHSTCSKQKFSK